MNDLLKVYNKLDELLPKRNGNKNILNRCYLCHYKK